MDGETLQKSYFHIPEVDYLSHYLLDQGEWSLHQWSLHPDLFNLMMSEMGIADGAYLGSQIQQVTSLVRTKDPLALALDALFPWSQLRPDLSLPSIANPALQILPCLLHKIEQQQKLVILIAPNWPRGIWYIDILELLREYSWPLPNSQTC